MDHKLIVSNRKVKKITLYIQAYIDFIKITLYSLGKLPLYLKLKNNFYTTLLLVRQLSFLRENFLNISNNLSGDLVVSKKNLNIIIKKRQQRRKKKYSFIFGEVIKSSSNNCFINPLIQSKLESFYIKLLRKVSLYTKEWLKTLLSLCFKKFLALKIIYIYSPFLS